MQKILIVCSGNTCRSPMAAALLGEKLSNQDLEVLSAGTAAPAGEKASPNSILALAEVGIDIKDHRATYLTKELIEKADLILTMTAAHKERVLSLVSAAEDKVFTLKEFVGETELKNLIKKAESLQLAIEEQLQEFKEKYGQKEQKLISQQQELLKEVQQIEAELQKIRQERNDSLAGLENEKRQVLNQIRYKLDIADPYGQDLAAYREVRDEIESYLEKIALQLIRGRNKEGEGE